MAVKLCEAVFLFLIVAATLEGGNASSSTDATSTKVDAITLSGGTTSPTGSQKVDTTASAATEVGPVSTTTSTGGITSPNSSQKGDTTPSVGTKKGAVSTTSSGSTTTPQTVRTTASDGVRLSTALFPISLFIIIALLLRDLKNVFSYLVDAP